VAAPDGAVDPPGASEPVATASSTADLPTGPESAEPAGRPGGVAAEPAVSAPAIPEPAHGPPVVTPPVAEAIAVDVSKAALQPPPSLRTVVVGPPSKPLPVRESHRPGVERRKGASTSPARVAPRQPAGLLIIAVGLVVILGLAFFGGVALRRQQAGFEGVRVARAPATHPGPTPHPAVAASPAPGDSAGALESPAASVPGTLHITTVPSGAQVEMDGAVVGVTALTLTAVAPGRRVIKISRDGFKTESREVDVPAGEPLTLDVTLAPAPSPTATRRRAPSGPPLPPPPLPPPP
jgi:hypothetical protein